MASPLDPTETGGRMPLEASLAALARLPRGARILGFDLGTKTIGLALSDVERTIATPLETLPRVKFAKDAERLRSLADRHGVGGLLFGLPINMDGSSGPRAQATRAFAERLAALLARPLAYWDERLSTAAVLRALVDADASRARRATVVDRLAAAYILQGALDRLASARDTEAIATSNSANPVE